MSSTCCQMIQHEESNESESTTASVVLIRKATHSDTDTIRQFREEQGDRGGWSIGGEKLRKSKEQGLSFIIEYDDRIIGMTDVVDNGKGVFELCNALIDNSFTGYGLLRKVICKVAARELHRMSSSEHDMFTVALSKASLLKSFLTSGFVPLKSPPPQLYSECQNCPRVSYSSSGCLDCCCDFLALPRDLWDIEDSPPTVLHSRVVDREHIRIEYENSLE